MPGVGGFQTYTGDIQRPTGDNVWQPLLLGRGILALVRDKRDGLANGTGTTAYLRPVVEVWDMNRTPFALLHSINLDDTTGATRQNFDLYSETPIQAKGSENGGKPWMLVNWRILRYSPSAFFFRTVTISWPDGIEAAPVRSIVDAPLETGLGPIGSQEMGTLAVAQQLVAWATSYTLPGLGYALMQAPLTP